jgi:hypothetical protein
MCLRIVFTSLPLLTQLSFNFFLSSSSHGSNPSSYSHRQLPSRPCCCLIFHIFFTSRIEHLLKHPSQFKFLKLSFERAIIHMKRVPNKRVVPILLWRCNLSKADFRLRNAQCFCHISLYGSSNLMMLDALERRFEGSSEYYFSSIVHL